MGELLICMKSFERVSKVDKPNLRELGFNQTGREKCNFLERIIEEVERSTCDKASELNDLSFTFLSTLME